VRVLLRPIDPDVEIDDGAGIAMYRQRMCAHDEELRFLLNEGPQDVAEVLVHEHY